MFSNSVCSSYSRLQDPSDATSYTHGWLMMLAARPVVSADGCRSSGVGVEMLQPMMG